MIVTQNKTTTLYSYQNGIGANTEAILNRTLRHILYGNGGEAASLILTATATPSQVSGNTMPVANISVNVDESLRANMQYDGSGIVGKSVAGATITIEVNT